jgi:hypothetical protein
MTQTPPSYHQQWWLKNKYRYKESRIEYEKVYRENHQDKRLLNICRNRAKKNGIDFNLTIEDIVIPKYCPVLKKEMVRAGRYAPSIDRIDSNRGYVKGNIQIISKLANRMKNDADEEELKEFAKWVLNL